MNHVIYQPWFITAPGNYIDNKCNMKTKLRNIVVPTLCPRSLVPLDIVTCYIKWVKTSWTDSRKNIRRHYIVKLFEDFESTGHLS